MTELKQKEIKLFISIPSNREWKGKFGACFAALVHYITAHGTKVPGYTMPSFVYRAFSNASCLSIARQKFLDEMIAGDYTHWLSLDDDMTFPMNIVDLLLRHEKDVVSCNARRKTNIQEVMGSVQGMDGKPLDSGGRIGIEELKTMGGAIFLAKIDAFRHIPKPHFQVIWSPEHNDYVSEDIYFAALLRANGVRLWCDHDASHEIGHIGEYEYKFQMDIVQMLNAPLVRLPEKEAA